MNRRDFFAQLAAVAAAGYQVNLDDVKAVRGVPKAAGLVRASGVPVVDNRQWVHIVDFDLKTGEMKAVNWEKR